jgi:hypothetical protein
MQTSTKDLSFVVWGIQILFIVLKLLNHVLKFEKISQHYIIILSLARKTYWIVGTLKIKVEMMNEFILKIIIFLFNLIYLQMIIILTEIDDFIFWCLMIMNATLMWILKNTLTIVFQCVDNSSAWSQSKMHFTKPRFGHHFFSWHCIWKWWVEGDMDINHH